MAPKILVVDDETSIREMLVDFLESLKYEVCSAEDGPTALSKLADARYDLVLSDINMPRMRGFELLAHVRADYPDTKRALITAYDVDDYLNLALEHDVGNIIPKSAPFNFEDVEMVVRNILTGDIFGLQRHMREGCTVLSETVTRCEQIHPTADRIAGLLAEGKKRARVNVVITELMTNAMFYGARGEETAEKDEWDTTFELPAKEAIEVQWASDQDHMGFLVADRAGRLKKKDALYWMCRQTMRDETNLPLGVFDSHGRGFFIARNFVDSLIINIETGKRTEVVCLTNHTASTSQHKPLYINEI